MLFYLTQRLINNKDVDKNSLDSTFDSYFRVDYMGSAEYEFGALPKSLKRICKNLSEYKSFTLKEFKTPDKEEAIRVFCKPDMIEEIKNGIRKLISEKYYTIRSKEQLYLYDNFHGENTAYNECDVWWDIEQDFFFTIGKHNMKNIETALKNTKVKFDKESS